MIIEYETKQTWGTTGNCYKCGYHRLHVTETTTAGNVIINADGLGQFRLIKTYTWDCAACGESGPLSNIDSV